MWNSFDLCPKQINVAKCKESPDIYPHKCILQCVKVAVKKHVLVTPEALLKYLHLLHPPYYLCQGYVVIKYDVFSFV